jgi:hypothetical protein
MVGLDGAAPKMAAIHCAFAEMAANEMRCNMGTTGSRLIEIWNLKHARAWCNLKRKGPVGTAGNGLANKFFFNQIFKVQDLSNIPMEKSPHPVQPSEDDNDDDDEEDHARARKRARPGGRQRLLQTEDDDDDDDEVDDGTGFGGSRSADASDELPRFVAAATATAASVLH